MSTHSADKEDLRCIGSRIRHLRRRQAMPQKELAERLGISVSYLNLLEHNHRKITIPLLLNLANVFGIDMEVLVEGEDQQLFSGLMAILGDDIFESLDITNMDARDFSRDLPHLARAMLILHDNLTRARTDLQNLTANLPTVNGDSRTDLGQPIPEIVSDFIQEHENFFPELEQEAERINVDLQSFGETLALNLEEYLRQRLDITVDSLSAQNSFRFLRAYDAHRRILSLSEIMEPAARRFAMAYQIGLMAVEPVINMLLRESGLRRGGAYKLGRIALANYFAASLILPYDSFLESAEAYRYDIELLQLRHKASFEQVCHRLVTLNHPQKKGIAMHFLKTDMAGNISKRFSLSGLAIPRHAGACPRWNIFNSFVRPGVIQSQISRLPNGSSFLCIAAAVHKGGRGWGANKSLVAIGVGCSIESASRTVYGDEHDLTGLSNVQEIGVTCRICERRNCAERVTPAVPSGFTINENIRGISPFISTD